MANKTPVSILQEYALGRNMQLPVYREGKQKPNEGFTCTVHFADIVAEGIGTTKKAAKQEAARNALDTIKNMMGTWNAPTQGIDTKPGGQFVSYLNEYAGKKGVSYPIYVDHGVNTRGEPLTICQFMEFETYGYGSNKKLAKHSAAQQMYELIKNENPKPSKARPLSPAPGEIEKVIQKYKELTLANNRNNNPASQAGRENEKKERAPGKVAEERIRSEVDHVEDLTNYVIDLLRLMNYKDFRLVFNILPAKSPIVKLKIVGTNLILMACGETVNEAKMNVLRNTLKVLKHGSPVLH